MGRVLRTTVATATACLAAMLLPTAAFAGTGAAVLAWSPAASGGYDYGAVDPAATPPAVTFTLTNTDGRASGTLAVALSGSAAFTLTSDGCTGESLGPGRSCAVTVTYTSATTSDSATLTATGEHGVAASLALTGARGVADIVITPGTYEGTNSEGTKDYDYYGLNGAGSSQTFTITNDGTATSNPVALDEALSGMAVSDSTCGDHTIPAPTLAPDASCSFLVSVQPSCPSGSTPSALVEVQVQDNGADYLDLRIYGSC